MSSIAPPNMPTALAHTLTSASVDLTVTALPAELAHGLDAEVGAVAAADVDRPAVGVGRHLAAEAGLAVHHEVGCLARPAQPEPLQPLQRDDAEAVVQMGGVDVGRA